MIKNCKHCSAEFKIAQEDLDFYDKISPEFNWVKYKIPEPTHCPDCRQQRRFAFRNERKLYKRKCSATEKNIISIYSPDKLFKVYEKDEWWSDKWDWRDYWMDFDFDKSFFEQFQKLRNNVPRMNLMLSHSENCDWSPYSFKSKNTYLCISCCESESLYYCFQVNESKNCVDCTMLKQCELCYECVGCVNCYNLRYSQFSENCSDSYFLKNCTWCKNCFWCINLKNKEYCYFNKQYTKEWYINKLKKQKIDKYWYMKQVNNKFLNFTYKFPHKFIFWSKNENCCWDNLHESKNSKHCFDASKLEDCKYIWYLPFNLKDSYDVNYSPNSELLYEVLSGCNDYDSKFILFSWDIKNSYYCDECFFSKNIFGCIWLKNKEYCILNKQYTKQEYEILVPKIINHMKKTHSTSSELSYGQEWWEFFPISISPLEYNETVAQEYFPLRKDQVMQNWWKWKDEEDILPKVSKIIPAEKLPANINNIPDDILNWAIQCENTQKPFKIIPQELKFYRENNIPIPHLHPDERHKERMKLRNHRKLYDRKCNKCEKHIQTTYSPDRLEMVYCEECYLQTVY